jgi:hypothetical protein
MMQRMLGSRRPAKLAAVGALWPMRLALWLFGLIGRSFTTVPQASIGGRMPRLETPNHPGVAKRRKSHVSDASFFKA